MKHKLWICTFCKQEQTSRRKLALHEKECAKNNGVEFDSVGRIKSATIDTGEFFCKFCNKKTNSKHGNSYHEKYCKLNPEREELFWKDKKHTLLSRTKIANSIIKNIEKKGEVKYNFNEKACEYIDILNEEKGWHLQHALNGGEIRCGPYSLDGYDKELNIVFEYDEKIHENSDRKEKDLIRQKFILDTLKPKEFWRYSEKFDKLYLINEQ